MRFSSRKLARSKAASEQNDFHVWRGCPESLGSPYVPRDGRCPHSIVRNPYTRTKRSHGGSPSPIPLDPPEERGSQEFRGAAHDALVASMGRLSKASVAGRGNRTTWSRTAHARPLSHHRADHDGEERAEERVDAGPLVLRLMAAYGRHDAEAASHAVAIQKRRSCTCAGTASALSAAMGLCRGHRRRPARYRPVRAACGGDQ